MFCVLHPTYIPNLPNTWHFFSVTTLFYGSVSFSWVSLAAFIYKKKCYNQKYTCLVKFLKLGKFRVRFLSLCNRITLKFTWNWASSFSCSRTGCFGPHPSEIPAFSLAEMNHTNGKMHQVQFTQTKCCTNESTLKFASAFSTCLTFL